MTTFDNIESTISTFCFCSTIFESGSALFVKHSPCGSYLGIHLLLRHRTSGYFVQPPLIWRQVQAGCGKGHLTDVPEGLPTLSHEMAAIMVYTSGTTGRPKGALHTHGSLHAQCISLSQAWHWERSDVILHCLPLHHIHGIVNAWICCMHNGVCVCVCVPCFWI